MRLDSVRRLFWGTLGVILLLLLPIALTGDREAREAARGIVLVGATVAGITFLVWWFRDRPERSLLRVTARRFHLRFSPRDPFDILGMGFALLSRTASSRHVLNVMWGRWQDLEIRTFEFREQRGEDDVLRLTCAMTPIPRWWPQLVVRGETPLGRAADALGVRDLQLESEDFNRAFDVRSGDPAFATALLDQRMMAWLLDVGPAFAFEVAWGWLLVAVALANPWQVEAGLELLVAFRERVPAVLSSLYPPVVPPRPELHRDGPTPT